MGENTKEKTLMDKFHDFSGGTVVKNLPTNAGDLGFPPVVQIIKESVCNAGNPGSIPGLGRSLGKGNGDLRDMGSIPGLESFPGVGNSNSLQNSCLENSMDREDWWIAKSQTRLSLHV